MTNNESKNDKNNTALAWTTLTALTLLGGLQLYRTHTAPWTTQQLARLNINGTQPVVGPVTVGDLTTVAGALIAALLVALAVRAIRRLFGRADARVKR